MFDAAQPGTQEVGDHHKERECALAPEIRPLGRSQRGNYEILPAFNSGPNWYVYCHYCDRWLRHGAGPGHRISHCLCPVHGPRGYSLRYRGEMRDLLDRLPSAHRKKLAGKRERRRREIAYLQDKGQLSKFTTRFSEAEFEAARARQFAIEKAQWDAEEVELDELERAAAQAAE
jgi:hypothetical protein